MWPFIERIPSSDAFRAAVKHGQLIDMQVRPYLKLHREHNLTCPVGITPSAYKEFVDVRGGDNKKRGVIRWGVNGRTFKHKGDLRFARWIAILQSFFHQVQKEDANKEASEIVYEVGILRLSGFTQSTSIKACFEDVGDNEIAGLLFMLPDEEYPLPL